MRRPNEATTRRTTATKKPTIKRHKLIQAAVVLGSVLTGAAIGLIPFWITKGILLPVALPVIPFVCWILFHAISDIKTWYEG